MIPPLPHNSTLVLRHTFPAPRHRVFQAWIEPKALEQWFKPLGKNVVVSKLDARVGGSFRFDVEDGTPTIGTYLHIAPPEKLVFTWSGGAAPDRETIVTLDFLDRGPMTEVVLTHERLSTQKMHEMFEAGWQSLSDTLTKFLSSHSNV